MRTIYESLIVAFSMYSKIPMPHLEWTEKNMRYAMCFYPWVGLVCGAVLYVIYAFGSHFMLSAALLAGLAVFCGEVLIPGGIHWDGYCDTLDALSSNREREEKLRILKDPHVGAFALIYVAATMLLQFGIFVQLFTTPRYVFMAFICYFLARALGGIVLLTFPRASKTGLAATFGGGAQKNVVLAVLTCYVLLCAILIGWQGGLLLLAVCGLAAVIFMAVWRRITTRQFGGINGDMIGFAVTFLETLLLLVAAVAGGIIL